MTNKWFKDPNFFNYAARPAFCDRHPRMRHLCRTKPAMARYLASVCHWTQSWEELDWDCTMRKIILTKNGDESAEEDISPKRRRDSEISSGDTSSGYSTLSEQFAGIKSLPPLCLCLKIIFDLFWMNWEFKTRFINAGWMWIWKWKSYILKAGVAGVQNPQKDCLRTRKISILQYVRNKGEEASSKT